jgi:hypothetical protein
MNIERKGEIRFNDKMTDYRYSNLFSCLPFNLTLAVSFVREPHFRREKPPSHLHLNKMFEESGPQGITVGE